ncbi:D-2-hydroxyacid dehydrogenase family protein [Labedaea rhizosphaerae]|uniref:Phosphoglycerate dehydrogenase-like enzyme n=1 Tax=Labedaea rhizosphaerae TaxID=598644 RepID=A0A4R6SFH4_LABRH|nr:D-2-hydroxyacid dehydrogenase family protein [Labedaea rhizosphaerae]TDQ00237.1 phosphoglycerate dehydrogenase-like enzyme [Labedaea rhizosphaerae]
MAKKCVVLDDYQGVALSSADWSVLGDDVELVVFDRHLEGEDAVADALADAEIVVIMRERTPFPASLLARLPKLELLVTSGMRNGSVDLVAAQRQGVTVCGTASTSTAPGELTWALILGLARHLVTENAGMRANGPWQRTVGTDLAGRTLGLLGYGKIGQKVAAVGRGFDMDVVAWSPNLTEDRTVGARLAGSLHELAEVSDVLSIHLVLAGSTRGLVGADVLGRMKRSALLINTSRAGVVDQDALIAALRDERIAGAGLDVFDTEPLPADHPFRTLPNVLATPHLGYVTRGNYTTYFGQIVEDIAAFLAGQPIRTL